MRALLAERARRLGFDALGVAAPGSVPELGARLEAWLAAGRHGGMDWMAERSAERASPSALWGEVRSVVMLGAALPPDDDPLAAATRRDRGTIATYARRRDYHEVLKGRMKELGDLLRARAGAGAKVFVDTAPVMEKPLAAAAGLGWQGKHTVLVSRTHGSWLLLGALYTTAELPPDAPAREACGTCRRCLGACPTDAFPAPFQLDASRCIAYLTIEHAGPIPHDLRPGIGNRVFGCDDCLAVCPWNRFAQVGRDQRLAARDDLASPPLAALARLDDAAFRARFAGTPIKRTGRDRFVRNVLVAIGNSGDPALAPEAVRLLSDPSAVVRGAAVWAACRLMPGTAARLQAAHGAGETDAEVRAEWALALAADRGDATLGSATLGSATLGGNAVSERAA